MCVSFIVVSCRRSGGARRRCKNACGMDVVDQDLQKMVSIVVAKSIFFFGLIVVVCNTSLMKMTE